MPQQTVNKVVLAYSGGLDTSVIVPWLRNNYGCEVICFTADLGQGEELGGLEAKAIASGASKIYIEDLREEFITDYLYPMLQAGAVYERKYLLGTSVARPLIAKRMVEVAELEGADAVAHGCTGKGNDQVRFELTVMALNPRLRTIAPWREWTIRSRKDALDYAAAVTTCRSPPPRKRPTARDRNLLAPQPRGRPAGGSLERAAGGHVPVRSVSPAEAAPDEAGGGRHRLQRAAIPESPSTARLRGTRSDVMLATLNALGAKHGVGRIDMVENRLVGMKTHGVYETPGGTILYRAHDALEELCLDKQTLQYKQQVALKYAELTYNGLWFTPLRRALDAFVQATQENISGSVRLKLYKGNILLVGRRSPHSLYREDYATFGEEDVYDQKDAEGFIKIFGLPLKVEAMLDIAGVGASKYRTPDYSKFKRD
jgi:argininosuccinate synthase